MPSDDVFARWLEYAREVVGKQARKPIGAADFYSRSQDAWTALVERIGSESGEPPPEMPIPMDGTWERVLDD
jgi:hypothetical protein